MECDPDTRCRQKLWSVPMCPVSNSACWSYWETDRKIDGQKNDEGRKISWQENETPFFPSHTVSDLSPKSITTLASTATSGLGNAAGIVELQKLVIELFALAVGQSIAARTILGADRGADGRLFHLRFLAFHLCQFRTVSLTRQESEPSKMPAGIVTLNLFPGKRNSCPSWCGCRRSNR